MSTWKIEGQYVETCNCDFLCPCITSNLAAEPTEGDCKAAIALHVEKGEKDGVDLSGRSFIVLLHSPGVMGAGNIKVGVIVDDHADDKQTEAITEIASGSAGGPMAGLAPLVSEFAGIEKRTIVFGGEGLSRSVKAGDLVEQSVDAVPSASREGEPIYLDNTAHPVSPRLALGHAKTSHMHAFGIDWDDTTGTRNGHMADFKWSA